MAVWSFPGTVTETVTGGHVVCDLDLGLHLHYPALVRIQGIRAAKLDTPDGQADRDRLADLLPAGTPIQVITGRLGERPDITGHVLLADGRDVAAILRDRTTLTPTWQYGGTLDKVWRYPATIRRVKDADTPETALDVGAQPYMVAAVRVEHCDAYESATDKGKLGNAWAVGQLTAGLKVTVTSRKYEKYGRVLGCITMPDGTDYASAMVAAGHAVPYEGVGPR